IDARAGELVAAPREVHAERAVLGDEEVGRAHRLGPGAPHAEDVPVVDDLVVAPRHEAHPVIDDALAVPHRHRQHVPVGRVDPAREVPEAGDDEAAVDPAAAAPRPAHRLGLGDVGEAARGAARPAHARVPAAWGIAEYSSPPQSWTSLSPKKLSSMVSPLGSLRKIW